MIMKSTWLVWNILFSYSESNSNDFYSLYTYKTFSLSVFLCDLYYYGHSLWQKDTKINIIVVHVNSVLPPPKFPKASLIPALPETMKAQWHIFCTFLCEATAVFIMTDHYHLQKVCSHKLTYFRLIWYMLSDTFFDVIKFLFRLGFLSCLVPQQFILNKTHRGLY